MKDITTPAILIYEATILGIASLITMVALWNIPFIGLIPKIIGTLIYGVTLQDITHNTIVPRLILWREGRNR